MLPAGRTALADDLFNTECSNAPQIWPDFVESDLYEEYCIPHGLICSRPQKPVLDDVSPDPVQAQTIVLKATKPLNYLVEKIHWRAEHAQGGGYVLLWEHETTDGVQLGVADPYPVRFGAPGLEEGETYYLRVAYCGSNGKCTCWSPRSAPITTDADFTDLALDPAQMKEEPGKMGFSGHHTDYFVDLFRAGWKPSGP